ncbi:hypothetical protein KUCAC02_000624, partial [Chaenocephalus aceratus]
AEFVRDRKLESPSAVGTVTWRATERAVRLSGAPVNLAPRQMAAIDLMLELFYVKPTLQHGVKRQRQAASWELICKAYRCKEKQRRQ